MLSELTVIASHHDCYNLLALKPFQPFQMITKAALRAEIAALKAENELVRQQCLKLEQDRTEAEQKLLTVHQYVRDLKQRWTIHQQEWSQAVIDMRSAGAATREVVQPVFSKVYSQLSLATGFTK